MLVARGGGGFDGGIEGRSVGDIGCDADGAAARGTDFLDYGG
jgi:hypothetical protein